MYYFYFLIFYLVSLVTVLVFGGYEIYHDTKRDQDSLTWGVLVGFLISLFIPIINTIVAVVMSYTYFGDFLYQLSLLMDKPILRKKG